MNTSRIILFLSLLPLVIGSCGPQSKEGFIESVDQFVEEVRDQHESYNEQDWEAKHEAFNQLFEENYKRWEEDMTPAEKSHLLAQGLAFGIYQYGDRLSTHLEENQEVYLEVMEANVEMVDELAKALSDDVIPELQRLGPDLERIANQFIEGLEERGTIDKLENTLEQFEKRMQELDKQVDQEPQ